MVASVLLVEFIIELSSLVIVTIATGIVYKDSKNSFLVESKILFIGLLVTVLYFLANIPVSFLSKTNYLSPVGFKIFRFALIAGHLSLFFICLPLILADFQQNYESIIDLLLISITSFGGLIINYSTIQLAVVNNYFRVIYPDMLGLSLLIANILVFIYIVVKRVVNVSRIVNHKKSPFSSYKFYLITFTLIIITLGILALIRIYPDSEIPGFTWHISESFAFLVFAYTYSKDNAFFFVTEAELDGILIYTKQSGIGVFSKTFRENLFADQLIGGILTALNLSLKQAVKSKKVMNQVSFGDRVVLFYPGTQIILVAIVSEKNFIVDSAFKFLTKLFEEQYSAKLTSRPYIKMSDYVEFEKQLPKIRSYIPL